MTVNFQKVMQELMGAGLSQTEIAREIRARVPGSKLSQPSICRIAQGSQSVSFTIGQALLDLHKSRTDHAA